MAASLQNDFIINTDRSMIDVTTVHQYLTNESYWAKNISFDIVSKAIDGSFCFGVYKKEPAGKLTQVGFARVITDKATFGYIADVFIITTYRGIGLAKWLMQEIINHPELSSLKGWMLSTKDAHGLYAQFGFKVLEPSERLMRRSIQDNQPEVTIGVSSMGTNNNNT